MSVIGLATLLYRGITGDLSLKMRAFDYWVEELGYEIWELKSWMPTRTGSKTLQTPERQFARSRTPR
jgi:hypothetical protein